MIGWLRTSAALACGVALGALPVARFASPHAHAGAHTDHAPRHGGQLGMQGDVHVEVAQIGEELRVYPSDARLQPLRALRGTAAFDDRNAIRLTSHGEYLSTPAPEHAAMVTVSLDDLDTPVRMTFSLAQ